MPPAKCDLRHSPTPVTPSAVVSATSVEQVQAVVKICNEYKIPVWTISTGRNFGYGSAAPVERGQIIALTGSTGRSSGPHLHYEIQVHGQAVDPRQFLAD